MNGCITSANGETAARAKVALMTGVTGQVGLFFGIAWV